ncbi:MAG: Ig-like domain repeat protein [Clostridia bacterium]|nr:Ig-like domain repeat protein [Clostridia bacterium]
MNVDNQKVIDDNTWTVDEEKGNLVHKMSKTIDVSNDSNGIVLTIKMTDRAGNVSEKTLTLNIDKTAPVVDVQMDDSISGGYKAFFNNNRTATITVKERNFISNGHFTASITDDKGKTKKIEIEPKFNLIKDKNGKPVSDKNNDIEFYTYEMTYTFVNDGDYTFSVDEITDIVGHDFNHDNGIKYSDIRSDAVSVEDGFKGLTFTIDHTRPEVTVKYDNYAAENSNYYKANRVATISIKEHNFNSDDVIISIISTDNATGTEVTTVSPKPSEWKKTGNNIYTATISYTNDSKYVFDIEYIDMAGNSIDDYKPETFFIDKTAPTLEITNVGDRTANNGVVAPAIHMFDTNFNKDKVTINLSGVNNGRVNYSNSTEDITNGQNVSYQDFAHVQSVDDIYTLAVKLTDMAGNESEKTIVFSANRYGSVYDISTLKQIIGKYLQKEKDIVFTETNVDNLDPESIRIKLTKNGTPKDLVLNKDYTINKIEQKWASWSQYTYTIKKALFANDGTYSISIFSKDAAGNINENIEETKKAEISFGIDKTKPVVVPVDFESGVQYAVNGKKVSIEIKDNLVLENVKIYLNGKEIEYKVEGETYSFEVPESNSKQTVRVVVTDAAGNTEELFVEKFLVSTNVFVRWYNNTPLFIGSIVGVVLIAGVVVFLVFKKRRSA